MRVSSAFRRRTNRLGRIDPFSSQKTQLFYVWRLALVTSQVRYSRIQMSSSVATPEAPYKFGISVKTAVTNGRQNAIEGRSRSLSPA